MDVSDEQVLGKLVEFQSEVAKVGADIKLVEKQNLHFTVKFLGEVTEQQVSEAATRLSGLSLRSVEVTVLGVGVFPALNRPSVIWAGVSPADAAVVLPIAETAIRALDGIGEADSRGFQPHLTLARVRSGRNRDQLVSLISSNAGRVFGKVRLDSLKLKSSKLTPGGPVYSDVGVFRLG